MPTLWKRMSDNPTNWRINYKGLQLLDHLIRAGSDKVIQETRERSFMLRQLQDFQCVEEGVERGSGVRTLSKQICDLVNNEKALKELRTEFAKNKNKYVAASSEGGYGGFGSGSAGAYDKPDDSGFSIQADPKQKKKKKKAKKEGSDEEEEKPKKPQDSDEEEEVPKKKKEKKNKKKEESEDEDGAKKGKSKSKEEEEAPKKAKAKEDEEGKKKKSKAKEDDSSKKSAKAFDKPFEFEEEEEETPKPKKKIEIKLSDKSSSVTPPRLNMPEESGSSKTVGFGLGEDWFAPQAQPKVTKSAAPSEDDWGDFGSATVTKAAPKAKHDDDFGFSDFTSAPTSTAKSSSFEPKPVQSQDFSIFSAPTVSSTNQNNFLDFDTLPPVNVFVQSQPQSQFQPQFQSQPQPQSQSQQQKPKANDDPWAGLVDLSLVDKPKEKRHITMNSGR